MEKRFIETKIQSHHAAYLLLSLTLLLIARLLPLLKAPLSSYGYDYGFYYYAASHATWHWHDLGQIVGGGYNSLIFSLGTLLHLPPAVTVSGSYFLAALALGLCCYFLMRKFFPVTGIFAVLLVACSIFQAEGYNMFLWKNIVALPFLVLSLKFLMDKNYKIFLICALAVLLLHRTTAIMLILTAAIYLIYELIKTKCYRLLFISTALGFLVLVSCFFVFHLQSIISNLIYNNNYDVRTGLFLEGQNLLALWWPSAILGLAGLILYLKNKQHSLLIIFTSTCLVWIAFQLPFYHRILIYLDLSVIFFAAYFLGQINYSRKLIKGALVIILIFLGIKAGQFILAKQPLITGQEISELKNFDHPPGFILAVSADDAPWLLAYTNNYRLGAPGLLEDPHTYQQWQDFWNDQNQRTFLSYYPRPLYFYQRSYRLPQVGVGNCLIPLSQNFSQLDYNCLETPSR